MDLRKLEIFVTVARLGNFSRAAEALHMAQPPVSIAVRKLEEELGAALLVRDKRALTLTHEGETVLAQAQSILQQVDNLASSVGEFQQLLRGEIQLACPAMAGTYFLPQLLGRFLDMHPGLTASVTQAGTHKIEQMLINDEIELGVVTLAEPHPELEIVPLVSDTLSVCLGSKHPLRRQAVKGSLSINALQGIPMVLYEPDYFIRQRFDRLCSERQVQPEIRLQTNYLPLLIKLVKQNHGATIGLKMMAEEEKGMFAIPLVPLTEVKLGVARRRGRMISRANDALIRWLAESSQSYLSGE